MIMWDGVDGCRWVRKEPVGFSFISILNRYGSLHVGSVPVLRVQRDRNQVS